MSPAVEASVNHTNKISQSLLERGEGGLDKQKNPEAGAGSQWYS